MKQDDKLIKNTYIKLNQNMIDDLILIEGNTGLSRSDIIRKAVDEYIERFKVQLQKDIAFRDYLIKDARKLLKIYNNSHEDFEENPILHDNLFAVSVHLSNLDKSLQNSETKKIIVELDKIVS